MFRFQQKHSRRSKLRIPSIKPPRGRAGRGVAAWRGLEAIEPRVLMSVADAVIWSPADGGNGHGYEAVVVPGGITWDAARAAAEAQGGHLVTITSQAENDFVFSLIDDPQYWQRLNVLGVQANGPWIGLFKTDSTLAAVDGWQWVTGEAFSFSNWATNEPNKTNELFASFTARGSLMAPSWQNTLVSIASQPVISYVIEYDVMPGPDPEPDPDPVPPNNTPQFTSTPPTEAMQDVAFEYHISVTDADGDALQFHAVSMPPWLTLTDHGDGTALLSGTPSFADVHSVDIVIEVSDGEEVVQQSFTLDVKPPPLSEISGALFNDANRNGAKDAGEAALVGWIIYDDADASGSFTEGEAFTVSGADGNYTLAGLQPGDHLLRAAAPVDLSVLDHTFLRYNLQRLNVKAALSDANHFQRQMVDDRTMLLSFEAGDDQQFDEMNLKVHFDESGKVTMTVLSRERKGSFTLTQPDARRIVADLGRGSLVTLDSGWLFTTPSSVGVSTSPGDQVAGVNFGAAERPERSLPRWLWNALERSFRRSR